MTLLTWNHARMVGVEAMDDQHGILMDALNELRQSIVTGDDRKKIHDQLEQLATFTKLHFDCEEQLLKHQEFPALAEHRDAHMRLMSQLHQAIEHCRHTEEVEMHSTLHFLRAWYLDHIEGLDQEYGKWLNERGVY